MWKACFSWRRVAANVVFKHHHHHHHHQTGRRACVLLYVNPRISGARAGEGAFSQVDTLVPGCQYSLLGAGGEGRRGYFTQVQTEPGSKQIVALLSREFVEFAWREVRGAKDKGKGLGERVCTAQDRDGSEA